MRLLRWLVARLEGRSGSTWVILLALLLSAPSLTAPLVADDLIHQVKLDPQKPIAAWSDPESPYFVFSDGSLEQRAALMEEGIFSWWAAEGFKLAFWRPLSQATHALDDALFPESSPLIHLHSLLWLGLLVLALSRLYGRLHTPRIALLALCVYAWDDSRGLVLSFASNRNAIVAAFFAVCTLIVHDRWRKGGWRPGGLLGPMLLAAALLSGEMAVATTAFLLSYALYIDEGSAKSRVMSLLPYALLTLCWLGFYRAQGFGSMNSGVYVHPLADPALFVIKLIERFPVLVLSQLGGPPSDLWLLYPPELKLSLWVFALLVMSGFAFGLTKLKEHSPAMSFWTMSACLSFVPVCATFPSDRLLVMTGIGASGALALLMSLGLERPETPWLRRSAALMVALHLVLAPLALPLRAMTMNILDALHQKVNDAIPSNAAIEGRTLVVPHALSDATLCYIPVTRAASHEPRPRALRLLATGLQSVSVKRVDELTLLVEPEDGFYATEGEQMTRSPTLPFAAGDSVSLTDMSVKVLSVNEAGRAMSAEFRFKVPLEDPTLLWMHFNAGSLEPWTPPGLGERVTLPPLL